MKRRRGLVGRVGRAEIPSTARGPAGFEGGIDQVTVGEVLHHQPVRVVPVVEQLAALDVPADASGPATTALVQILASGGDGIQVGNW
jgi:hypothetical protein